MKVIGDVHIIIMSDSCVFSLKLISRSYFSSSTRPPHHSLSLPFIFSCLSIAVVCLRCLCGALLSISLPHFGISALFCRIALPQYLPPSLTFLLSLTVCVCLSQLGWTDNSRMLVWASQQLAASHSFNSYAARTRTVETERRIRCNRIHTSTYMVLLGSSWECPYMYNVKHTTWSSVSPV